MTITIRIILTLALLYGAYRETGIFTGLSLFLIFVTFELQGFLTKRTPDGAIVPEDEIKLQADEAYERAKARFTPRR